MKDDMKSCALCGASKALGDFYKKLGTKTGRYSYCKPCSRVVRQRNRAGLPGGLTGTDNGVVPRPAIDRVLERLTVNVETGCHEWTGPVDNMGYGSIAVGLGPEKKTRRAHQVVWEHMRGPMVSGLVVDHLCRNRRCCNPEHLEAVTQGENVRRGESLVGKNSRKTHCQNGHEFSPENTIIQPRGRACRVCVRVGDRRRWREKRSKEAGCI